MCEHRNTPIKFPEKGSEENKCLIEMKFKGFRKNLFVVILNEQFLNFSLGTLLYFHTYAFRVRFNEITLGEFFDDRNRAR